MIFITTCTSSIIAPYHHHTPGYNKLGKVAPIITMLRNQFADVWNPEKNISIDEAIKLFKGTSSLKQYMPMKPIKRGIKFWVRADAHNGYISAFPVYTGRKGNTTEKGPGATVVKGLTGQLYGTYHHVFYDDCFLSMDLALGLLRAGIYSCGTL